MKTTSEEDEGDFVLPPEATKIERIGLGDVVIVLLIAAGTWFFQHLWAFPGLYPGVWDQAVVAAGVRPASAIVPGYWTILATWVYDGVGISRGEFILSQLGHAALAVTAILVYASLREWLAFAMRMRPQFSKRRTLVQCLAATIGTIAFVSADPVWSAGQCLSETTILMVLTLGSVEFFFVFLRKGSVAYAYLCAMLMGLLAAESPFGLVLPLLLIMLYVFIVKYVPSMNSPLFKPAIMEVAKWHMTFLFLLAFIAGIALNCWSFVAHDGIAAVNESIGSLPLTYLLGYWHRLASAGSVGAWILWVGVCLVPTVVTMLRFPSAADEELFLPYASGLIFFFCGILVFAQSSFVPALWFWTYFPMNSQLMLLTGLFCCAATLAGSVTILGVDALCRNHRALAKQFLGEELDEADEDGLNARRNARLKASVELPTSRTLTLMRRFGIIVLPTAMILLLVPGRVKKEAREMLEVIRDAIAAIVTEAGDARHVFTDGNLDAAIELESARRGGHLVCHSLMGGGGLATYLRTRDLGNDEEDLFAFRYDTATGLRTWIRDKPDRLDGAAVLMGFDLWKRDGKPLPPMGGFLSRPGGFASEEVRESGIAAAHALGDRMERLQADGSVRACTDQNVTEAFLKLQWRLARMCLYRSEYEDRRGMSERAIADAARAKRLNDTNRIYRDLVAMMEKQRAMMLQKLTPREGLQLALVRADFTMGKLYSETILAADPENPDANFAMGMYYLGERQFSRAETYLKRCLIRKPEEPAIYNNLAMIQIELGRFDAARSNIEKALKIIPDSAAVLDTKKALEAAIEKKRNPPKKAKAPDVKP